MSGLGAFAAGLFVGVIVGMVVLGWLQSGSVEDELVEQLLSEIRSLPEVADRG